MAQEEWYIKGHPELFKDNLDKWLFKELGIMGGCCSSQKAAEYITAREVGEKLIEELIERACEWIKYHNENGGCLFDGWEDSFRKAMEE